MSLSLFVSKYSVSCLQSSRLRKQTSRRLQFEDNLGKSSQDPSQPPAGYGGVCLSPQLHREAQIGRSWSGPSQAQSNTLFQKYSTQKRADGVTQEVECLSHHTRGLSSNPSTSETEREREREREILQAFQK
jgi:hypothetical protein